MQELEVTWGRALSVTWLIFWRGMLGAMVIGGLFGFVVGFGFALSKAALKFDGEMSPLYSSVPGALVGLGWYLVVIRMALEKKYKGFRIALLPRQP